ncbi:MAG: ATP-binding cassette domain-containing protein [Sandaracinaceae bacterium]|nr:ATP-binding cassette domain-containing protein [Sandaracinaceae bacterium]
MGAKVKRLRRLLRLWDVLRPHLGRFSLATGALLVGGASSLVYPQAARYAVDEGISGPHLDLIAAGLIVLFLLQAGVTWMRHYQMSWLGQRAVAEMRRRVFSRLLALEPGWFHTRSTGELTGRLASDVAVVEGVVGTEISMALRNALTLIGGVILLLIENAKLTGVMLLVVPPLMVTMVFIGKRIRQRSRSVQDRLAEASARVQEAIGAIETVQGFVREEDEAARYAEGVEAAFEAARRLAVWRGLFMSAATFAGFAAIALILWVGGHAVERGDMSGGSLTAFMLYTTMVAVSLGSLAGLWGSLQRAAGATDRLFEIIDAVPEIKSPADPTPLPPGGGELRLEGVTHRYPTRPDVTVLEGLDLVVRPGETVALVGRSGAGKSTLARLLPRFMDPTFGRIRLDGVDLRELALEELRTAIATVSQEPVLFSGTIAENIAYGAKDATQEEIEQAARDAYIDDLVRSLPDGYATLVGERGVALSGGQRQRVAIARALLAQPRLLILDEATSHLDAESEAAIQKALDKLLADRTALIIAHRLSTVRRADRIVVVDKGQILEQGTHAELMGRDGLYRRLVELQLLDENDALTSNVGHA